MKTLKIKVYEYAELNEKAKEQARYWLLSSGLDSQFEWECTQEDAKNVDLILEGTHHGTMKGHFLNGAVNTAEKILKEHGKTCETYKTAKEFLKAYNACEDDSPEQDSLVEEFELSILEDYRILSDKNQEHIESEEYMADAMEANGYTFTEDGKRQG